MLYHTTTVLHIVRNTICHAITIFCVICITVKLNAVGGATCTRSNKEYSRAGKEDILCGDNLKCDTCRESMNEWYNSTKICLSSKYYYHILNFSIPNVCPSNVRLISQIYIYIYIYKITYNQCTRVSLTVHMYYLVFVKPSDQMYRHS